ncbi:MAG: hypothetical protein ACRD1E_06090 [Terriglobales bacterium]
MAQFFFTRRLVLAALNATLFATVLAGQAAPLALTSGPAPGKPGTQLWTLTNTYSAAATEWVIGTSAPLKDGENCKRPDPQQYGNCIRSVVHTSALPGLNPAQLIGPRASRMLPMPAGIQLRNLAVIYADGASAGDPAMVGEMLAARQILLNGLRDAVRVLQDAAVEPNTDYRRVLETFKERSQALANSVKDAARQAGPNVPPLGQADKVWAPLARDLRAALGYNLTPEQINTRLTDDANRLQGWLSRMQPGQPGGG